MPQDEPKPTIKGSPLTSEQLEAIADITPKDINRAIAHAPAALKKFLLSKLKEDARKNKIQS
jgi:hypothetical protein